MRVALRIRPKNADELAQGADFDTCVELQPEVSPLSILFFSPRFIISIITLGKVFHIVCWSCCLQCKKLKLKKNNWASESYQFDEIFGENSSQKRIYEVVAKPVVEASHVSRYFVWTCIIFI